MWYEAVSYEQWRMGRTLHTTGWAQGLEQNWFSYIKTWSHDVTKLQQNSRHSKGTNLGWGHPKTVFHRFSSSVQSVAVMIETNKILSTYLTVISEIGKKWPTAWHTGEPHLEKCLKFQPPNQSCSQKKQDRCKETEWKGDLISHLFNLTTQRLKEQFVAAVFIRAGK